MFFSLFWQREGTKRDHVARFVSEGISTLRTELRDSLRSNRSSLLLRSRSQSLHSLAAIDFVELAHARHSPSKLGSASLNRDFLAIATDYD